MQIHKYWTDEEIKWLKENYENNGPSQLAKISTFTKDQIKYKAQYLGLKVNSELYKLLTSHTNPGYKSPRELSQNYIRFGDDFQNVVGPEISYILGLLWADGYLDKKRPRIVCSLTEQDAIKIEHIFDKTGEWNKYYLDNKNRNKRCKPSIIFEVTNKIFYNFLVDNDYYDKTLVSADKILSKIPENLKHYWWRGYFDGDGYISNKRNTVVFGGHINMNYEYIVNMLESLQIYDKPKKREYLLKSGKCHRQSILTVQGCFNIIKLYNFLYIENNFDGIGFPRKWESFVKRKMRSQEYILCKIKRKTLKLDQNDLNYFLDLSPSEEHKTAIPLVSVPDSTS